MKKKCTRFALLFLLTVALCSVTAFAAGEKGIYNVVDDDPSIVEITPQTADGTSINQPTTVGDEEVYVNAERIAVDVPGAESGKQYLIIVTEGDTVPVAENIVYIDQKEKGSGPLTFAAYPKALSKGITYSVWLASSSDEARTVGSFEYYMAFLLGYVDDDDTITATDAQWALQISVGNREATAEKRLAADADNDGQVTATDAQWILQASVGNRTL